MYKSYFVKAHDAKNKSKVMMDQLFAQAKKEGKTGEDLANMQKKDGAQIVWRDQTNEYYN